DGGFGANFAFGRKVGNGGNEDAILDLPGAHGSSVLLLFIEHYLDLLLERATGVEGTSAIKERKAHTGGASWSGSLFVMPCADELLTQFSIGGRLLWRLRENEAAQGE